MNLLRFAIGLCLGVAFAVVAIEAHGAGGGRFRLKPRSAPTAERDKSLDDPFPRTVADDRGHTMTIPSPPQRIASHEMTVEENLFAVVEESRIVTVSRKAFDARYSNMAAKVERLGLPTSEEPETVLRLRPELILAGSHARAEWVDLLRYSGAPIYRADNSMMKLADLERLVLRIDDLIGTDDRAAEVAAAFRDRLERVRALQTASSVERPRILGYNGSMSYSNGGEMLFHDIVTLLGGVNVGADQGLEACSGILSEQIAAWDPEWIVTGAGPGQSEPLRQALMSDPGVAMTTAVRTGQILILPNNVFLTMSHPVIELVEDMVAALYPEAA